jgi:hypothetical protein
MLVHVYMGTVVNVYGYEGDPLYTTKHANAKPGSDSQGFVELRIKLVFYPIDHLTHFFKSIDGRLSVIQCHP